MMKQNKVDLVLLGCFLLALVAYVLIFGSAFLELPLNISPWHQFLLLSFHLVPTFFLQLLMCHVTGPAWRLALPPAMFLVPALVFALCTGGQMLGWVLAGFWCIAPLLGCALGWLVWGAVLLVRRLRRPGP